MDTCRFCNLQYKRIIKYNHELNDTHLAANYQYFCEQGKRILNLADKKFHLPYNDYKKFFYCKVRKKH